MRKLSSGRAQTHLYSDITQNVASSVNRDQWQRYSRVSFYHVIILTTVLAQALEGKSFATSRMMLLTDGID